MFIYLVGMMGSGKSTIGKYLSMALTASFLDTDTLIKKWKQKSILELFMTDGEKSFREMERILLTSLRNNNSYKLVISTGGGMPCYNENMEYMLSTGIVIFLNVDEDVIIKRLQDNTYNRPLLQGVDNIKEELRSIYNKRRSVYEQAQFKISDDSIRNTVIKATDILKSQ